MGVEGLADRRICRAVWEAIRLGYLREEIDLGSVLLGENPLLRKGRQNRIARRKATWLLGHSERSKVEELILDDVAAGTAAKLIKDDWCFALTNGVVEPAIGVQSCISKIFENTAMNLIAPPASNEIHLHCCQAHALVQVRLARLNGHFLYVFQARFQCG